MTVNRSRYYIRGQSTSLPRYILEQTVFALLGWIPGILGIALRAVCYRLVISCNGFPAIESGVRLAQPANIKLGASVYLDQGTYLHACPQGISIGEGTLVMWDTELHVYNFRRLPHAGIHIGRGCIIGEGNIIRGPGGVKIGDHVLVAPGEQILSSNHLYGNSEHRIMEQGVSAEGIVIEDGDSWLDAHTHPQEVVLSSLHTGHHIPSRAGNKPVIAHWAATVDFLAKREAVKRFYDASTPDAEREGLLREHDVRYVYHGSNERALGSFEPSQVSYLEPLFASTDVTIYAVHLKSESTSTRPSTGG